MIINLHGFRSIGNNSKYEIFLRHFGHEAVYSPTLPASPFEAIDLIESFLSRHTGSRPILVGTSLGGFYAYVIHHRWSISAHLINPSLTPWNTLAVHLGIHTRFDSLEPFEWTAGHVEELRLLGAEVGLGVNPGVDLHFYLGMNDEVIDHSFLRSAFPDCGKIWTDDSHRFSEENIETYVVPAIRSELEL